MKTDDKVGSRAENTGRKLASNLGQKESEGRGGEEGEGGRERQIWCRQLRATASALR